jgi:phage/plasmid primase-like uncharacterized protein
MTFDQALRLAGLIPREIVPDGRIRRCATEMNPRKRNGWYVLNADGHGAWGDWTTGSGQALGTWEDDNATTQAVSPEVVAKMAAQRDRERQYRIQSVRSARQFWNNSRPLSMPHVYLSKKGLLPLGCAGLRVNDGLLVIPVILAGHLVSLQTIDPQGVKLFWPGAPVKAGSYILHRDRYAITIFVEGLATGLAVFQSVKNARVVVCFDAGNLLPAAQAIKPTGSVVFMADNDWKTKIKRGMNPGVEKATNAAELIGAGVAWCEGIEGSDADDFLREIGEGAARKLERLILSKAKYVGAA